jgi:hypothetical protein
VRRERRLERPDVDRTVDRIGPNQRRGRDAFHEFDAAVVGRIEQRQIEITRAAGVHLMTVDVDERFCGIGAAQRHRRRQHRAAPAARAHQRRRHVVLQDVADARIAFGRVLLRVERAHRSRRRRKRFAAVGLDSADRRQRRRRAHERQRDVGRRALRDGDGLRPDRIVTGGGNANRVGAGGEPGQREAAVGSAEFRFFDGLAVQ